MISFDSPFVCQRSGQCCEVLAEDDHWRRSHLTKSEVKELLDKRKAYTARKKGCGMLVYDDGKASCLVEKEMGYDKKHSSCKQYPEIEKPCLRQILKRKNQRRGDMRQAIMDTYERKIGKAWAEKKADRVIADYDSKNKFEEELREEEREEVKEL